MKVLKLVVLLLVFPIVIGATSHKFYVSITKVEHVAEEGSLQIITQIFLDDIEDVLQQRYNKEITLGTKNSTPEDAAYFKRYILQKLKIKVNGEVVSLDYLGEEYEIDMVKAYIEVTGVDELTSIEIENKILLELTDEQQNIIHYKAKKNRKSMILDIDNPKGVLNFN